MGTAPRITAQPRQTRLVLAVAALVPALAATIAATHASAAGTGAKVKVEKTALGRILVNGQGRTLYMFAIDKHGKSACYGTCAKFWPPLLSTSSHVTGTGVKASLLGTSMRKGGTLQLTYAGHPLYTFLKDAKPGQTNGQGLNASGGLWWVMSPTGTVIKKTMSATPTSTTPAATTTSSSGGGGGWG
jgi:predicted lipoprotein with Yx(FWY)xxD motif